MKVGDMVRLLSYQDERAHAEDTIGLVIGIEKGFYQRPKLADCVDRIAVRWLNYYANDRFTETLEPATALRVIA